jgi:PAS domain S-box-containing protein
MPRMIQASPLSCDLDLRSTLEAMDDLAFVFDASARLIFLNQPALRMFGLASLEEALDDLAGRGRIVRVVRVHGQEVTKPLDLVQRALAGEKVIEDFERLEPVDGRPQVTLRLTVSPIVNASGDIVGVLKVGHDVTFERELADMKEDFVRVTSHELRTPAAILRLAANRLLSSETLPPDELRKRAETIDRATRRIESIAIKLADIASICQGGGIGLDSADVSLDAIVADVVAGFDECESGRIQLSSVPASVRGDAKRLRQVLACMLDNALRYSTGPVEVTVRANDGVTEVAVVDHGVGIPPAKRQHLFEPFYRAHNGEPFDRGGLGASLYLAHQIMRAHQGRIWFEANSDAGSTFHIAFDAPTSAETP